MGLDVTLTNRSDINRFLVLAKRALLADGLWIVQRDKNREFLRESAITRAQQEDAILALTESDYSKGPEPDDRERPGVKRPHAGGENL